MTRTDYLAMTACYSLVAAMFVLAAFPASVAAFIMGLLP